jgi:phosphoserine phosphatase RsbU/P
LLIFPITLVTLYYFGLWVCIPLRFSEGRSEKGDILKILIAEDNVVSRVKLESVLPRWGYQVVATPDGNKAWEVLNEPHAPRLVILDWMMPGIDGLTLCRKLKQKRETSPFYIILLTGMDDWKDVVHGFEAGADDYIKKPYDNQELRARLNAGRRILELQAELTEKQKLVGALEMAGAVCHELNQPLHVILGYSELLLRDLSQSDPNFAVLDTIKSQIGKIGTLTNKIMNIWRYETRDYLGGTHRIVDIEKASQSR